MLFNAIAFLRSTRETIRFFSYCLLVDDPVFSRRSSGDYPL